MCAYIHKIAHAKFFQVKQTSSNLMFNMDNIITLVCLCTCTAFIRNFWTTWRTRQSRLALVKQPSNSHVLKK